MSIAQQSKVYNGTPAYSATIKCVDPVELTQTIITLHAATLDELLREISHSQASIKAYGFELDHFPFNQPQPAHDLAGGGDPNPPVVPTLLDGLLDENGVQCLELPRYASLPTRGGRPQKWCADHQDWMWLKPKNAMPGQRTWWSHPIRGESGQYCYGREEVNQEKA